VAGCPLSDLACYSGSGYSQRYWRLVEAMGASQYTWLNIAVTDSKKQFRCPKVGLQDAIPALDSVFTVAIAKSLDHSCGATDTSRPSLLLQIE
jgi:hypothetical protein